MVIYFKGNGFKGKLMVLVFSNIKVVVFIKDFGLMICKMVMEYKNGLMVVVIKDNLKMV